LINRSAGWSQLRVSWQMDTFLLACLSRIILNEPSRLADCPLLYATGSVVSPIYFRPINHYITSWLANRRFRNEYTTRTFRFDLRNSTLNHRHVKIKANVANETANYNIQRLCLRHTASHMGKIIKTDSWGRGKRNGGTYNSQSCSSGKPLSTRTSHTNLILVRSALHLCI